MSNVEEEEVQDRVQKGVEYRNITPYETILVLPGAYVSFIVRGHFNQYVTVSSHPWVLVRPI